MQFPHKVEGCKIGMTQEGKFSVEFGENDKREYDTYVDAANAAKTWAKQKAKIKMEAKLPVVTDEGKRTTITGVHSTRNAFNVKPNLDYDEVYPQCKLVEDLLREKLGLEKKLEILEEILHELRVGTYSRAYVKSQGGYIDSYRDRRELVEKVQGMIDNYAEGMKLVAQMGNMKGALEWAMEQRRVKAEEDRKRRRR